MPAQPVTSLNYGTTPPPPPPPPGMSPSQVPGQALLPAPPMGGMTYYDYGLVGGGDGRRRNNGPYQNPNNQNGYNAAGGANGGNNDNRGGRNQQNQQDRDRLNLACGFIEHMAHKQAYEEQEKTRKDAEEKARKERQEDLNAMSTATLDATKLVMAEQEKRHEQTLSVLTRQMGVMNSNLTQAAGAARRGAGRGAGAGGAGGAAPILGGGAGAGAYQEASLDDLIAFGAERLSTAQLDSLWDSLELEGTINRADLADGMTVQAFAAACCDARTGDLAEWRGTFGTLTGGTRATQEWPRNEVILRAVYFATQL